MIRTVGMVLVGSLLAALTAHAQDDLPCGPVRGQILRIRIQPASGPGGENVAGYALKRSASSASFDNAVEYPMPLDEAQADAGRLIWQVGPFDNSARHFIAALAFRQTGAARTDSPLSNVLEVPARVSGPCPGDSVPAAPFIEIIEILEMTPEVQAVDRARRAVRELERGQQP